mgnify:CR=1 FL=1
MSQTYVDAALAMAGDGLWNDLFNGTNFSIFWVGPSSFTLNRYISTNSSELASGTFSWSPVASQSTQFTGSDSGTPGKIQWSPASDSRVSVSQLSPQGNPIMTSIYGLPSGASTCLWNPTLDLTHTDPNYFFININIADPSIPLVSGSIATTGGTTSIFGISIVAPGPGLQAYYCTAMNPVNVLSTNCQSFCSSNSRACNNNFTTACTDPANIASTGCMNWCSTQPGVNCTATIQGKCQTLLTTTYAGSITDLLNSQYNSLCACYLSSNIMNTYASSVTTTFKVPVPQSRATCYFPPCSLGINVVPPFEWKQSCNNCAIDSGCITSVNVNPDGSINGAPTVFSSNLCQNFLGGLVPQSGNGLDNPVPAIPNACKSPPPKPKPKHTTLNSVKYVGIFIGIAAVISLAILLIKSYHKPLYKKKSKSPDYMSMINQDDFDLGSLSI